MVLTMINLLSQNDIKNFKNLILNKKFNKILLITGYNSFYKSGADKFLKGIIDFKKINFFFKKKNYPDIKKLKYLIKYINKLKPDLIIAIGGGCVLDYAKIANVFFNEENIEKKVLSSNYDFKKKQATLIAIPTTAGSGAEVTPFAVLYIKKVKYSVEHSLVKPDYYFVIPKLVISGGKNLKASTGFDAIAQALESMISVKSNSKSLEFSEKSLILSIPNYANFIKKPNTDNTFKMGLAANLSGKAISIAKTNGPHATSYPFSVHYGINHGHAVSLTINQFMVLHYLNSNKSIAPFDLKKRFHRIFRALKVKNIYEFDLLLKNLKKEGSLEGDYKKLGINISSGYSKILSGVNEQRLGNCPIKINRKDIKSILLMDI